jgi:hypothetical protein
MMTSAATIGVLALLQEAIGDQLGGCAGAERASSLLPVAMTCFSSFAAGQQNPRACN